MEYQLFEYLDKGDLLNGLDILDKLYKDNINIFKEFNIDGKNKMIVKYFGNNKLSNLLIRYEIDNDSILLKNNMTFFKKVDIKLLKNYLDRIKCNNKFTILLMSIGYKLNEKYIMKINDRINYNLKINNNYLINYQSVFHKFYPRELILSQLEETEYKFNNIIDNWYLISELMLIHDFKELIPKIYPHILYLRKNNFQYFLLNHNHIDFQNYINNNDIIFNYNCNYLRLCDIKNYLSLTKILNYLDYFFKSFYNSVIIKFINCFNENILNQTINNETIKNYLIGRNININTLNFTNIIIV